MLIFFITYLYINRDHFWSFKNSERFGWSQTTEHSDIFKAIILRTKRHSRWLASFACNSSMYNYNTIQHDEHAPNRSNRQVGSCTFQTENDRLSIFWKESFLVYFSGTVKVSRNTRLWTFFSFDFLVDCSCDKMVSFVLSTKMLHEHTSDNIFI